MRGARIKAVGSTALRPDALLEAAGKSLAYRVGKYISNHQAVVTLFAVAMVVAIATQINVIAPFFAPPAHLINAAHYNLNTIRGQLSFDSAIQSTNYYSQSTKNDFLWLEGITLGISLTYLAYRLYKKGRHRIPRDIAKYDNSTS